MGAGPRTNLKIYFEDAVFTFAVVPTGASLRRRETDTVLVAGAVKDLIAVVFGTDGSQFTAAAFAVVRLEQDGDADDGKYWDESGASWETGLTVNQVSTHLESGQHLYQLPAAATTGRAGASIHFTFTDDLTEASATTVCAGGEHLVRVDVPSVEGIADAIWDEILTGATHNIQNSAGKILRQLKEGIGNVIDEGDFQAGSTTTTAVLALTAPAVDASLPGSLLVDTVQNTFWVIVAYDGTTKIATLFPDRGITPGTGNAYIATGGVFSIPVGDQFNVTTQLDVRQSWAPAQTPAPLTFNGTIHLESNGERVTLPGGAACSFQAYNRDGTLVGGFSGSGTLRVTGSDSFFDVTATLNTAPTAGETIIVRATITGSPVAGGVHNGNTAISFPEF